MAQANLIPPPYSLRVFDNTIPLELRQRVWEHLLDQTFYTTWYDPPASKWYPRTKTYQHPEHTKSASHRCPMAWDESSLEQRHPVIHELWTAINHVLGGDYEIEGKAEGMPKYMTGISPRAGESGHPGIGWLVYCLGAGFNRIRPKSIHRDNININEPGYYTLVYYANLEWYPSWYAETIFWHDDSARTTGDVTGKWETDQSRDFPIGAASEVVSPLPGRFMIFDSRYMHSNKAPSDFSEHFLYGIVFRIRKCGEYPFDNTNS